VLVKFVEFDIGFIELIALGSSSEAECKEVIHVPSPSLVLKHQEMVFEVKTGHFKGRYKVKCFSTYEKRKNMKIIPPDSMDDIQFIVDEVNKKWNSVIAANHTGISLEKNFDLLTKAAKQLELFSSTALMEVDDE